MAGINTEGSTLVKQGVKRIPNAGHAIPELLARKHGEPAGQIGEQSPLLSARDLEDNISINSSDLGSTRVLEWHEGESQESKSTWYLFILTLSIGGYESLPAFLHSFPARSTSDSVMKVANGLGCRIV